MRRRLCRRPTRIAECAQLSLHSAYRRQRRAPRHGPGCNRRHRQFSSRTGRLSVCLKFFRTAAPHDIRTSPQGPTRAGRPRAAPLAITSRGGAENRRRVLWQDRHRILPRPQNLPKRRHPIDGPAENWFHPSTATIELPGASVNVPSDNPDRFSIANIRIWKPVWGAPPVFNPLAGRNLDPDWVAVIWECWVKTGARTGCPGRYTAGERNKHHRFRRPVRSPGNRENPANSRCPRGDDPNNLEYFGEDYTSNHLSNNGRGLLKIGRRWLSDLAADGARIMVAEAERIFGRSGLLNEGQATTILGTRNYIDAISRRQREDGTGGVAPRYRGTRRCGYIGLCLGRHAADRRHCPMRRPRISPR